MAERLIPRKTKVKMELVRGLTIGDFLYLIFCGLVFFFFLNSNLPYGTVIGIVVTVVLAFLIVKSNDLRLYVKIGYGFKFLAYKKLYVKKKSDDEKSKGGNIKQIIPYEKISGRYIDFKEYNACVVEISPIGFYLLNEYKQNILINSVANGLRRLTDTQSAAFYKTSIPMNFDEYNEIEGRKWDSLNENAERGLYSQKEVDEREVVFNSRFALYDYYNDTAKVFKDHYYFVVYGKDQELLNTTVEGFVSSLSGSSNPINCKILEDNELAIFLKSTYGKNFDSREAKNLTDDERLNWVMPDKLKFKASTTMINNEEYNHFVLADYPMIVGNAWASNFFSLNDSIVCVNFKAMQRLDAEKMIDNSILEMQAQLDRSFKASQKFEKENALNTIQQLLGDLKSENESLFNVNIHIISSFKNKKDVRARLKEDGLKFNEMFGRQVDAFISSNVSSREDIRELTRGMQTSTVAGMFPFISSALEDDGGLYMGYNAYPVMIDFFKRDNERTNSNMIIIGRSGSGKSYAAKNLLAHLAADDGKVFILDVEKEYIKLANNLGGKIVDVGSGMESRFNPLQIMETLDDEDGAKSDSFSTHLQFLEQFFANILEGISSDAFETLNSLVTELYKSFKITSATPVSKLTPTDFPTFDDLYDYVMWKHNKAKDEYLRTNYKIVLNYISKFATGGRNAGLWNGPSSITTNENFVVFNFQTLLANKNQNVLSAQMLLVFKYLENEIIKNKDYNDKYKTKRKIVLAVDEAHTFINPKFPIALDFMFSMAKRIRKYNGMQIIITQNIRDFMGSEDMIRQSSAIISASQYSMIFSLSPNDVTELVKLYKNAGEINESEQDQIATAGRGYCFFISGAMSRTSFQIEMLDDVRTITGE